MSDDDKNTKRFAISLGEGAWRSRQRNVSDPVMGAADLRREAAELALKELREFEYRTAYLADLIGADIAAIRRKLEALRST